MVVSIQKNKLYFERNQKLNKTSPSIPLEIKFKEEINPRYNYEINNPYETKNLINTFDNGSILSSIASRSSWTEVLLHMKFEKSSRFGS